MNRLLRTRLALVAVGFASSVVAVVVGQGKVLAQSHQPAALSPTVPNPAKPEFPKLNLPQAKSSGQRAIDLLADRLPEVAAWYGFSAQEFRTMLLQDKSLKIDATGRLFVEE